MLPDQTYLNVGKLAPARYLQRAGQWDIALESIAEVRTDTATALRAEILVDRHAWRLDPPGEALEAVERLRATDESLAVLLAGQLAYWQRVFDLGGDSILPDVRTAFAEAAHDKRFHGWAVFFGSVCCQYLVQDEGEAAEGFANALAIAHDGQDLLLESYALRHQGELRQESDRDGAVDLLRRSLALRVALGARPHSAAGQATLAGALGDVPEAAYLRSAAGHTAERLGLTWLK